MRFLVDDCLPSRLAAILNSEGHDAAHIVESGLGGAPDTAVVATAAAESRVSLSADTDFGELLASAPITIPSVVLFRRSTRQVDELAAVLLADLGEIAAELNDGALVIIADQRIRIRRLPLL